MEEEKQPQKPIAEAIEDKNALETVTLKGIYSKAISNAINVGEEGHKELKDILQRISNENSCVLMAFIAPWTGKKVSPYDTVRASIRISEELGIDKAIIDIKTSLKENGLLSKPDLMLVVNSPGGLVNSSYIVSKMIRDNFANIKVFIPHTAASGGTLLALTGNEIVMGEMSRLSPVDTQLRYKNEIVSAQSYQRAIERFEEYFKDKNPYEVPYVWKAMAEKFDPILREEWNTALNEIWVYMDNILQKAGYKDIEIRRVVLHLIFTVYPHSFVIDRERAERNLKLKVKKDTDYPFIWDAMKAWCSIHLLQEENKHIIRYLIPNKKADNI